VSRAIPVALLAISVAAGCSRPPESAPATPEVIRTGERLHVIAPGETLPAIAALYGVTEQAIRERNPGLVPDSLAIGKGLRIPPSKPEVRRIEPASASPR